MTVSLFDALNAADEVTIDRWTLDLEGGELMALSGTNLMRAWCEEILAKFEDQQVNLDTDGEFTAVDTDGKRHDFFVQGVAKRPLTPADILEGITQ